MKELQERIEILEAIVEHLIDNHEEGKKKAASTEDRFVTIKELEELKGRFHNVVDFVMSRNVV